MVQPSHKWAVKECDMDDLEKVNIDYQVKQACEQYFVNMLNLIKGRDIEIDQKVIIENIASYFMRLQRNGIIKSVSFKNKNQ